MGWDKRGLRSGAQPLAQAEASCLLLPCLHPREEETSQCFSPEWDSLKTHPPLQHLLGTREPSPYRYPCACVAALTRSASVGTDIYFIKLFSYLSQVLSQIANCSRAGTDQIKK